MVTYPVALGGEQGKLLLLMDTWQDRLGEHHPERSEAIVELRAILLRGLKSSLSGRHREDSANLEDIAQKALLKILENLGTYQGRGKFTSWALAITIRVAYNDIRARHWNNVSLDYLKEQAGDSIPEESVSSASPDVEAQKKDSLELVRRMIQTDLTTRQQDVLLAALNGMPQEEIASQMGTNRNNVYKLFHDGRKALKRAMEQRGYSRDMLYDSPDTGTYDQTYAQTYVEGGHS